MRLINQVLKQRNLTMLESERQMREAEVNRHGIIGGPPCHCGNCNRMRDEVSKITARIRRVRAGEKDNGD